MAKKQKSETVAVVGETVVTAPKKRKAAKASEHVVAGDVAPDAPAVDATPSAPVADATPAPVPDATPPSPKRKRTKATETHPSAPTGDHVPTLTDLAAGYLSHLEASGKSPGTVFSYRLELAVALDELGNDTPVRDITPDAVLRFFTSDRVTKTRSGVLKARVSVEKTKRVLRQALAWAEGAGLVERAPVPGDAAA